jgi:hypothetical protein
MSSADQAPSFNARGGQPLRGGFAGSASSGRGNGGGSGLRDDQKEQVREATDIADLVGSYVALRRQGRNLVGL